MEWLWLLAIKGPSILESFAGAIVAVSGVMATWLGLRMKYKGAYIQELEGRVKTQGDQIDRMQRTINRLDRLQEECIQREKTATAREQKLEHQIWQLWNELDGLKKNLNGGVK